jgi:hypothetical protein
MPLGGDRFWQLAFYIFFIKKNLPLQVVVLDEIPVDNFNLAYPGAYKNGSNYRAQCAAANNHRIAFGQFFLPFLTDGRK